MQRLRGITRTSRARYALVVSAMALFGLLSMHGWGSHAGAHSGGSHPPAPVVLLHDDGDTSGPAIAHGGPVAGDAAATDADAMGCNHGCGDSGSEDGLELLGLCLAILGGLVLAFVLLLRRCVPPLRTLPPRRPPPIQLSRERDPPDLLRLCVIRC